MHPTPAAPDPARRPQWGRPWLPITPPGYCELCHRPADMLATINVARTETITIATETGTKAIKRPPVYILVCRRHANGNGAPVAAPCTTIAARAATRAPAQLRLFDVIPYDRRAGRHG